MVWDKVFGKYLNNKTDETKYKKGDAVRISRVKPIFEKGYLPTFSDEIFFINKTSNDKPNHYELKDHKGEVIEGRFYGPELCKVRVDENTTYRIKEVLGKRTRKGVKEIQVKFIGYKDPY